MASFAAHRVLVDPHLLRHITTFKRGWPQELLTFWQIHRELPSYTKNCEKEYIPIRLINLIMRFGDVHLAELSRSVVYWDGTRIATGITLNASYIEAVKRGHVELLKWSFSEIRDWNSAVDLMWHTAFSHPTEDTAIFDFLLSEFREQSVISIHSHMTSSCTYASHRNALVLVKWLTDTFPDICLPSDTTEYACEVGNLELVTYLHLQRPQDGCTSDAFFVAKNKKQWHVLEYLLRNRREFVRPDWLEMPIKLGEMTLLEALHTMGLLKELLQGYEEHLIDHVYYKHTLMLEWCVDNDALTPQSISIDRLAWWKVPELIKKVHHTGFARATEAAIDNACEVEDWVTVRFLLANRSEGFTHRALLVAEAYYRPEIVRLLHANAHLNKSVKEGQPDEDACTRKLQQQKKLLAVFQIHEECEEEEVLEKAASRGRVDVLKAAIASGLVDGMIPSAVIEAALKSQVDKTTKMAMIQFLFNKYPASFGPELLSCVLLHEAFDVYLSMRELHPEQAETVLSEVLMTQAVEEYRLSVVRFVVDVLGRRDLVPHAIEAAENMANDEYTVAVRSITDSTTRDVGSTAMELLLTDPSTPSWAVRLVVIGAMEKAKAKDKYKRLSGPALNTFAIEAIYTRDQPFLELVHQLKSNVSISDGGDDGDQSTTDSLFSFSGARAAAIRMGDLSMLQWLVSHVADPPVEPSLLDEAIFYHQREIAQWLATHHPEACTSFAVDEKPLVFFCASGFDLEMLQWIEDTPVVRERVDFGALACYAVQLGDAASVQRMYETHASAVMAQVDLAKWLKKEHVEVRAYLQSIGYPVVPV